MRLIKNSCAVLLLSCLVIVQLDAVRLLACGNKFDMCDAGFAAFTAGLATLCGSSAHATQACYAGESAGDCTHLVVGTAVAGLFVTCSLAGGAYRWYWRHRQSAQYVELTDRPGMDF